VTERWQFGILGTEYVCDLPDGSGSVIMHMARISAEQRRRKVEVASRVRSLRIHMLSRPDLCPVSLFSTQVLYGVPLRLYLSMVNRTRCYLFNGSHGQNSLGR